MSKKIGLCINGRDFSVDVEDGFAVYLQDQMLNDFSMDISNDLKKMFHAYVKTNYELYQQDKEIKELLKKTEL